MYVASETQGTLFQHKDAGLSTNFEVKYSATYELTLAKASIPVSETGPPGYFFHGKWNHIGLVCSEPLLESQCQLLSNFLTQGISSVYLGHFFLNGQTSSLALPVNQALQFYSRVSAWGQVLGGSLASVSSALQEGAYSLTQYGAGNSLRTFYSLTDGDISDQITGANANGIVDAQFSYYWVPTDFGGIVGEVKSQCLVP